MPNYPGDEKLTTIDDVIRRIENFIGQKSPSGQSPKEEACLKDSPNFPKENVFQQVPRTDENPLIKEQNAGDFNAKKMEFDNDLMETGNKILTAGGGSKITGGPKIEFSSDAQKNVIKLLTNRGISGQRGTGITSAEKIVRAQVISDNIPDHFKLQGNIDHLKKNFLDKYDLSHIESYKNLKNNGMTNKQISDPENFFFESKTVNRARGSTNATFLDVLKAKININWKLPVLPPKIHSITQKWPFLKD